MTHFNRHFRAIQRFHLFHEGALQSHRLLPESHLMHAQAHVSVCGCAWRGNECMCVLEVCVCVCVCVCEEVNINSCHKGSMEIQMYVTDQRSAVCVHVTCKCTHIHCKIRF